MAQRDAVKCRIIAESAKNAEKIRVKTGGILMSMSEDLQSDRKLIIRIVYLLNRAHDPGYPETVATDQELIDALNLLRARPEAALALVQLIAEQGFSIGFYYVVNSLSPMSIDTLLDTIEDDNRRVVFETKRCLAQIANREGVRGLEYLAQTGPTTRVCNWAHDRAERYTNVLAGVQDKYSAIPGLTFLSFEKIDFDAPRPFSFISEKKPKFEAIEKPFNLDNSRSSYVNWIFEQLKSKNIPGGVYFLFIDVRGYLAKVYLDASLEWVIPFFNLRNEFSIVAEDYSWGFTAGISHEEIFVEIIERDAENREQQ